MPQYSHSRLSSYENCPRQFRYRYIDQVKTETEGIEAFVGKRVHEILERLYHHVARHRRPPSLSQVHERFQKDWLLHWHKDVQIVRREFDREHYQQIGVRCLENYYRGHYPFDEGETVGIEQNIQLTLDPAGRYSLRGIIDRVVRRGEGRYEIHDYKTGALPPRRRIDEDRQLTLYQIGLEQTYSDVREVELIWHYLSFNRTFTKQRSREELDAIQAKTRELIDVIETSVDYPAQPGPLCRWCDYRGICPDVRADARPGASEPLGPEPPVPGEGVPVPGTGPVGVGAGAQPAPAPEPVLRGPIQLSLL